MINFIDITKDIILYICAFLSDKEVINLFNTCSAFYKLTKIYRFRELFPYHEVVNKSYFESFTSISHYEEGKLHNNIKRISVEGTKTLNLNGLLPDSTEMFSLYFLYGSEIV